jgi:hypothetical protein
VLSRRPTPFERDLAAWSSPQELNLLCLVLLRGVSPSHDKPPYGVRGVHREIVVAADAFLGAQLVLRGHRVLKNSRGNGRTEKDDTQPPAGVFGRLAATHDALLARAVIAVLLSQISLRTLVHLGSDAGVRLSAERREAAFRDVSRRLRDVTLAVVCIGLAIPVCVYWLWW